MKQLLKRWAVTSCTLLLAFTLAACGNSAGTSSSTSTSTSTSTATGTGTAVTTIVDLSAQGIITKGVAHTTWTTTAPHDTYTCTQCHSVAREQVCAQSGCHPFSKYAALATNFDHTASKTGEQCNKCHSLTPEPTATDAVRIAGWRENVKTQVSDTVWHPGLKGVCLNCHDPVQHSPFNISVFPASHQTDTTKQTACETCHYYQVNTAGTGGIWGGGAHPAETTGCATATCHTHTTSITETHYQGGTAPAGQHYDANTGGPFNCEWCHGETITNNYASWVVTFDKATHQNWNTGSCKACHPSGTHPAVTTGCRTATCHTHTKPTTQLNQDNTNYSGQHYDANPGGSVGAGPFECEWCHKDVASGGYTSWSLSFSKSGHRKGSTKWDIRSCGACHPNAIPN